MSRTALVRRFFGDGEHEFRIGVEQAIELQERFDCGLSFTLDHVVAIRIDVIREVLRLGLIGAGMMDERAFRMVDRHVQPGYFADRAKLAFDVVEATLRGAPDETLGESAGGATTDRRSPEGKSDGPTSTASHAPPASDDAISSTPPSGSSRRNSKATSVQTPRKKSNG